MNRVDRPRVTKRTFLAAGAAFGLGACAARAQDMPAHERELYEAAKKEGELTWYSGQIQAEPGKPSGMRSARPIPGSR